MSTKRSTRSPAAGSPMVDRAKRVDSTESPATRSARLGNEMASLMPPPPDRHGSTPPDNLTSAQRAFAARFTSAAGVGAGSEGLGSTGGSSSASSAPDGGNKSDDPLREIDDLGLDDWGAFDAASGGGGALFDDSHFDDGAPLARRLDEDLGAQQGAAAAAPSEADEATLRVVRSKKKKPGKQEGGRWTKTEDKQLRLAIEKGGPQNWAAIATQFLKGKRTDVQCLERWQKVLEPGLVKGAWTSEEDRIIITSIAEQLTKWSDIADRIPGRIGKQCRERWFNHLDPSLKKGNWTDVEDAVLVEAQKAWGNSWTKISRLLEGRSENQVKNRWNSATRRRAVAKSTPNSVTIEASAKALQMIAAHNEYEKVNGPFVVSCAPPTDGGGLLEEGALKAALALTLTRDSAPKDLKEVRPPAATAAAAQQDSSDDKRAAAAGTRRAPRSGGGGGADADPEYRGGRHTTTLQAVRQSARARAARGTYAETDVLAFGDIDAAAAAPSAADAAAAGPGACAIRWQFNNSVESLQGGGGPGSYLDSHGIDHGCSISMDADAALSEFPAIEGQLVGATVDQAAEAFSASDLELSSSLLSMSFSDANGTTPRVL